jgi:hypothetical protein
MKIISRTLVKSKFREFKQSILSWFLGLFFPENQKSIYRETKASNFEEFKQWKLNNIIFPLIIFFIPIIIAIVISEININYLIIVLNGSLSLIGINILFGMSSYLIKYKNITTESNDEAPDINTNLIHLRDRLSKYKDILVFIGASLYMVQVLFYKHSNSLNTAIFILIISIILFASVFVGRFMFIIRDDFIDKTYLADLPANIEKHTSKWNKA